MVVHAVTSFRSAEEPREFGTGLRARLRPRWAAVAPPAPPPVADNPVRGEDADAAGLDGAVTRPLA